MTEPARGPGLSARNGVWRLVTRPSCSITPAFTSLLLRVRKPSTVFGKNFPQYIANPGYPLAARCASSTGSRRPGRHGSRELHYDLAATRLQVARVVRSRGGAARPIEGVGIAQEDFDEATLRVRSPHYGASGEVDLKE
jgi:hypothetical protein